MFKLSKPLRDELDRKGLPLLMLEAFALVAFIGASYGALLLINVYAQTQGA